MIIKPIKRVVVVFDDGTRSTFEVPGVGQGFYRERYTFLASENETKETNRIVCHELFWSKVEKEPVVKAKEED